MRGENSSEGSGPVQDPLLQGLDLSSIADERARESVARLLNLVERLEPKDWHKSSKKQQIHIDRQEKLEVDPQTLSADAEFKGYEKVIAQDLRISSDNVEFLKAESRSEERRVGKECRSRW